MIMARKGSVLVVDDEEIMRDVLDTLLSSEGYRVDLAKTGEEGLDAYTKRSYDAVLLDVSMPGIGGLRALDQDGRAVVSVRVDVRKEELGVRRVGLGRKHQPTAVR